jgi:hypothetical protein
MYSMLSDEESESSVFISVYTISHDSSNTSDTDSNEVSETLNTVLSIYTDILCTQSGWSSWVGLTYIADHPDTTFSDFLDDRSSDEEPFNEDNMYRLDHVMMVVSESSDDDDELEPDGMESDVHSLQYFPLIAL